MADYDLAIIGCGLNGVTSRAMRRTRLREILLERRSRPGASSPPPRLNSLAILARL